LGNEEKGDRRPNEARFLGAEMEKRKGEKTNTNRIEWKRNEMK
jgi:hypothetical protein